MGWIVAPSKRYVYPDLWMWPYLRKKRVFADVIKDIEMRSFRIIQMGPKSNDKYLIRERQREIWGRLKRRRMQRDHGDRLEWGRPRAPRPGVRAAASRSAAGSGFCPGASGGSREHSVAHAGVVDVRFCFPPFKLPAFASLFRKPGKTNTLAKSLWMLNE